MPDEGREATAWRDTALHRTANFLLRFATPNYRAALDATYRLGLHNLDEMASWSCPYCGKTIAKEADDA